jgi:hypothetical protein
MSHDNPILGTTDRRVRDALPAVGQAAARRAESARAEKAKRLAIVAACAFLSINIWTGAPLLALWVGSQFSDQHVLDMAAVVVVVVVLAGTVVVMAVALTWLSNIYDELIGRPPGERRATWLRSARAEERGHVSSRVGVTVVEWIVMVSVWVAVIALMVWLVFVAGSMAPSGLR